MSGKACRTPTMLLRARARVARELVREGQLEPLIALYFTVWPTEAALETEAFVPTTTLAARAFSAKLNR